MLCFETQTTNNVGIPSWGDEKKRKERETLSSSVVVCCAPSGNFVVQHQPGSFARAVSDVRSTDKVSIWTEITLTGIRL